MSGHHQTHVDGCYRCELSRDEADHPTQYRGDPMSARVEVDPVLVSCSVRYALGRHSYLPGLVADEVRRTWPELGEQRAVIRQDIARWLEQMGTSDYVMGAGWSTARPTWDKLLQWIDTRSPSDVEDACPRCGSTNPSRRFSYDNGRTHCGHGWHFTAIAPSSPEEPTP